MRSVVCLARSLCLGRSSSLGPRSEAYAYSFLPPGENQTGLGPFHHSHDATWWGPLRQTNVTIHPSAWKGSSPKLASSLSVGDNACGGKGNPLDRLGRRRRQSMPHHLLQF